MGYYEGEIGNLCGNNNGFGSGWEGLIGLALVAGLFDNGGGGIFGNRGNGNCGTPATQADIASGFANNSILSNLNDMTLANAQGFASVQQTLCQGFSGVNSTVNTGFAGVNNAICTLGYQNQQGFNGLSREIADCCCTTNRNIDAVRYENAKNTCDIIRAGQDNTRAILDYLTGEKISSLQAENSTLKAQISNDMQTRTIVSEIKPCPVPAYITCNPYQSAYGFGNGFGGCGTSVL